LLDAIPRELKRKTYGPGAARIVLDYSNARDFPQRVVVAGSIPASPQRALKLTKKSGKHNLWVRSRRAW